MTSRATAGIRRYISENIWIIVTDIFGALLLLSLFLTAAGAPALKQWMFVLLTAVPVMAAISVLTLRRQQPPQGDIAPPGPALERKIYISPRPCAQRTRPAVWPPNSGA
ncbi:MAG: hypothetical protein HKN11_02275 [Rhizobiales bacterium]|nr:hypothetical protein [Hyphomicrobiales bacterium]